MLSQHLRRRAARLVREASTFHLSTSQEALLASVAPGRVSIVRGLPGTGKTTAGASLLGSATTPTLALTPHGFDSSLRRRVEAHTPIGFLEAQDDVRLLSIGAWSERFRSDYGHTATERVLSHTAAKIFSAPMLRTAVSDTLRCFNELERYGVSPSAYANYIQTALTDPATARLSAQSFLDVLANQTDLCDAYTAYRDLLHEAHCNTHDGVVLDALELVETHPYYLHASLATTAQFVVDDLHLWSPGAVLLLARMMLASAEKAWILFSDPSLPGPLDQLRMGKDFTESTWSAPAVAPTGMHAMAYDILTKASNVVLPPSVQLVAHTSKNEVSSMAAAIRDKHARGERLLVVLGEAARVDDLVAELQALHVPHLSLEPRDLFETDVVSTAYSLLQTLASPSDSKHLFHLLNTSPEMDPVVLARIMESSTSRHIDLYETLVLAGPDHPPIAAFLKRFQTLRDAAMKLSCAELLHLYLTESGTLEALLHPANEHDVARSEALAAFLDVVLDAQRHKQSPCVPFVVPYLTQLRETGRLRAPSSLTFALDDALTDHRVLVASQRSAWRLPSHVQVDTLMLLQWHDKAFPGRKPRGIGAGILPSSLLEAQAGCKSSGRDEYLDTCRQRLASLLLRARASVLISHTADAPISRLLAPWASFVATTTDRVSHEDATPPPTAVVVDTNAPLPLHHLSFSQIDEYMRCPHRYYLSRVLGLEPKANSSMVYGRSLHEAIATYASVAPHASASEDALAAFAKAWTPGSCRSLAEERMLQAQGAAALRSFIAYEADRTSYIECIEQEFEFHVPEANVLFRGVWDRVERRAEDDVFIVEFKSNLADAARDNQRLADESLQLKLYMLAYHRLTGTPPKGAVLRSLETSHGRNAPGVVAHSVETDDAALSAIQVTARAIRARSFDATPSFLGCAFCAFRDICEKKAASA
ncbi:hypothetical protein SPRG_06155 [Saprolegnia parasitica CBS 223.65]|uniref:UvrD-like helicase C-terminal domain-containing protein n=1 Tax=Saprolegnia parasitica (strain CBS 223.65) TaxID=695850 RepID=A0A067CEC3_SAPPC|nr:hypothetical protein SPRG_06155 [Saprolegnia parasitica CBS 223.65]KDO29099.1 hypothetical protein SPRG_06155 [Saprolegnia parasitica CBS 223.65]|eukprot:XP_012200267.1 hypothetical protein SPRG_06155 [Saprolegnia parasitica CBS 223.65]